MKTCKGMQKPEGETITQNTLKRNKRKKNREKKKRVASQASLL